ncbi:hypothetical protein BGZ60DRAFT_378472 [Tricladium varicosporioides]|nr:hypothetical protein BGZ60DRAFT_378472 [Hymenoscyphus varicosporioides]
MVVPPPNTSLSLPARLLCYMGPPSAILLTAYASPKTALLAPITFLPTAWFYQKWERASSKDPQRRGELEPMVWIYATAGTLGLTAVAVTQILVCKAASALLFGSSEMRKQFWVEFARTSVDGLTPSELASRAALASSWQNWVFNAALFYIGAGLCEETLKYLPVVYCRRRGASEDRKQRDRAYLDYAMAGALSFGIVESIGFIYGSVKEQQSWPKLALTLFERVVIGQLGHLAAAALTAFRAIRKDYYGDKMSWWGVILPAVLFHGTYDYAALAFSASEGNVGWIHPAGVKKTVAMIGLAAGMIGIVTDQVRREWKELQKRDAARKTD